MAGDAHQVCPGLLILPPPLKGTHVVFQNFPALGGNTLGNVCLEMFPESVKGPCVDHEPAGCATLPDGLSHAKDSFGVAARMVLQRQIPAQLGVKLRPIGQNTSACSVRRFALKNRQVAHGLNALTGLNGRLAVQLCCRIGEHVEVDDWLLGV